MTDIKALISLNAQRWQRATLTRNFDAVAKRLVASKARYVSVERETTVPWFVIAVIHEREADQSWGASIAQGDSWLKVSIHAPAGRGPFKSWDDAAIDALTKCAPHAAEWKDWSAGGALTLLEEYNGLGYAYHGVPSPYIWSGTDQYKSGKYVADHVYNADVVDSQLGCAGLIMAMRKIDPTIKFHDEPPIPDVEPSPPKPASSGFFTGLLNKITSIFNRS